MSVLPTPYVHVISLNEASAGEQLATCGQRSIWNVLQWPPDRDPQSLIFSAYVPVPANVGRDAVLAAIEALVSRYDSLRTRFRLDDQERLWQLLRHGDVLGVEIYAVSNSHLRDSCENIRQRLVGRAFDLTTDLPIRVALVEVQSIPRALLVAVSHAAADYVSMHIIESKLLRLLRPASNDTSEDEPFHQPFDQAAFEQSAQGRRTIAHSMRAWRTLFESMPRTLVLAGCPPRAAPGRFWLGRLRSRMLHRSLATLSERYRTTTSLLTLTAIAIALGQHAGVDLCPIGLVFSNRVGNRLKDAVGNFAQITCAVVDVSGRTFGDVVNDTRGAALLAYRRGLYDTVALNAMHAEIGYRRGVLLKYGSLFNDIRTGIDQGWPASPEEGDTENDDERNDDGSSSFSFLRYEDGDYLDCMFLLADDGPGRLQLALKADTTLFSAEAARRLLEAVETILVKAMSTSDMAAIRASTGLVSPDRDERWLMVERSWTYLPAVEQLIRDAIRPAQVRVVAERRPDGEPVLVAHVVPAEYSITPDEVHAACVALLDAHPTAVTPHRYTLYSNMTGEFRDRTIVAEGPGR